MRQHPFLMTRIGCLSIPVLPTVKEKDVGNAQLRDRSGKCAVETDGTRGRNLHCITSNQTNRNH